MFSNSQQTKSHQCGSKFKLNGCQIEHDPDFNVSTYSSGFEIY